MKFVYAKGATPIDDNEAKDLIPFGVTLQAELNELEEGNILRAEQWAFQRKNKKYLSMNYLREVHRKMFDEVWKWAGEFRKTNKNLGVDKSNIQSELKNLLDDVSYWIAHNTYSWPEIGARFHHRLVSIHPFPNGNGRHARMMTDILLFQNDQPRFHWGVASITGEGETRSRYISALKEADKGNLEELMRFVK